MAHYENSAINEWLFPNRMIGEFNGKPCIVEHMYISGYGSYYRPIRYLEIKE